MDEKTLGEFIEAEIKRRNMSASEFARFVDVPVSVMSKFRNHGVTDTYSGRAVGDPSLDFLVKLAKATHVDLCALVALTRPDGGIVDPQARVMADFIIALPDNEREQAEIFIEGLISKMRKKQK